MFPWGHLALGYLLLAALRRSGPSEVGALAVAFGTQLPDLVDKPLAWTVGLLASGRSLGHSGLVAVVVLAGLWLSASERARRFVVVPFGIGYVSHILGDALYPVLGAQWGRLGFLLWPVVRLTPEDPGYSILAMLLNVDPTPAVLFETGLFAVALAVWVGHRRPGEGLLRERAVRLVSRS